MIVDASVAVKWLVEENLSKAATRLATRNDLVAPDILDLEVAQALTRKVRQRNLQQSVAEELWVDFAKATIQRVAWQGHAQAALALSFRLRATFVDCLYLAIAIDLDDTIVTADERFVRAVRTAPSLQKHIASLAEL